MPIRLCVLSIAYYKSCAVLANLLSILTKYSAKLVKYLNISLYVQNFRLF